MRQCEHSRICQHTCQRSWDWPYSSVCELTTWTSFGCGMLPGWCCTSVHHMLNPTCVHVGVSGHSATVRRLCQGATHVHVWSLLRWQACDEQCVLATLFTTYIFTVHCCQVIAWSFSRHLTWLCRLSMLWCHCSVCTFTWKVAVSTLTVYTCAHTVTRVTRLTQVPTSDVKNIT